MNVVHADRAIAKRLLRGDETAFREVFDSFFPKLYRFALARMNGNEDDAREVVQETFCKAFERLDSYRAEASLYGWMCQICRNTITDHGRRRQRQPQHVTLIEEDSTIKSILETIAGPVDEEPESQARRRDMTRLIQATLDSLPGHYGDVLEWKYVDGLTVNEIAERLTVSPKAAESALTRARNAFREAIEAIGGAIDVLPEPRPNT
ncbi:MAG: sigma-70 family RNA polymerase sigma factor [Gammaproteobacteria bacterium]|nr:sigma-70 family RNA polymerase sigma factor [Gammaproteobacteria bacterium]